jgi:hypothetical protein
MTKTQLSRIILSDLKYDHLIAEVEVNGSPIFLLDREDGRENVCISFRDQNNWIGRMRLDEFITFLTGSEEDLNK